MSFIVGIGASAGGLDALEKFFKNMPDTDDISFVVVQHLSSNYKNIMDELLAKYTERKIFIVQNGMDILPGCIYLISSGKNMTIYGGKLFLEDIGIHENIHLPIDRFFHSLAGDKGDKAVGVILSGTGSDGTKGIMSIKEMGGHVIVQDPLSAQFDGMPSSAIGTGASDHILIPEYIGKKIMEISMMNKECDSEIKIDSNDKSLQNIFNLIMKKIDLDLTHYKQNTILRGIERRMNMNKIDNIQDYLVLLNKVPEELKALCSEMLIGVTHFFRDNKAFHYIQDMIIPEIFRGKKDKENVRVWVAGCSTGEEAYSLAILFKEYLKKSGRNIPVKIFATDIDDKALEIASAGLYNDSIVGDIGEDILSKYFVYNGRSFVVSKEIREMIIFSKHNLIKDSPFNRIDLISCRNLLIYFRPILQQRVLNIFNYCLNSDGYLFLGPSESIGEFVNSFYSVETRWKVFKRKEATNSMRGDSFANSLLNAGLLVRNVMENNVSGTLPTGMPIDALYKWIIHELMCPAVIVDENYNVMLICGNVNEYLEVPKGRPSYNITEMIEKKASISLITSLRRAFKDGKKSMYHFEREQRSEKPHNIKVTVELLPELNNFPRMTAISFDNQKDIVVESPLESYKDNDIKKLIKELKGELQFTKENLQATIKELETSNEELVSLNADYQAKISELSELNNDMDNFLTVTNIGAIFLDKKLKVRKFTNAATKIINLLNQDIGRYLSHISHSLIHIDIAGDAALVLKNITTVEKEVRHADGKTYIMKIVPYRTRQEIIKGATITFVDITELKRAQEQIEKLTN